MPIYASLSENRSYSHNTLFPFGHSVQLLQKGTFTRSPSSSQAAWQTQEKGSNWPLKEPSCPADWTKQKHAVMTNYMHHEYPSQEPLYKGSMRLPLPSRNMLWNPEANKNCWCSMLTGDLQQWFFSPLTERGHKRATEVRQSANL